MKKVKISELKKLIVKGKEYAFKDLWKIDSFHLPKQKKLLIKTIRTLVLAFRGFKEDHVNLRASSLTFFSLLSVVPVMALAFGFAKAFGMDGNLESVLQKNLKGQEEVVKWIVDFANNMLENVQGSLIIGVGAPILIWTVIKVLGNIENSFNSIWQVKKPRAFFRKFSDYLAMMLLAPILLIMSGSLQVVAIKMVKSMTQEISILGYVGPFIFGLVKLIPYILMWLLFTVIYVFMPNTKVKFSSALVAGIIAGVAFQLLQWGYFHFQIGVSRFNAIYGGFAALPLFLVWLNWSWLIVLFGAEISFAAQNQHEFEFESDIKTLNVKSKQLISILITQHVIQFFEKGDLPPTSQQISINLKLPIRIVRFLLNELVECRILAETPTDVEKQPGYLPAKSIQNLTIMDVTESISTKGSEFTGVENNEISVKIEAILSKQQQLIKNSDLDFLVKEL